MPFYVSPDQQMKDRADYARKGIARGRSVVVLQYDDGILFVADNPSRALHKVSEIYDRIAFAAVGKYNEFENLRLVGVRYADVNGYMYDRSDVTSRGLANFYAQMLGTIFTDQNKPYEVELVVAEVGEDAATDQIYRLTFDGSVADEHGFVAMGGQAEAVAEALKERYRDGLGLAEALRAGVHALEQQDADRHLDAKALEVAVLDRNREHRLFRRLTSSRIEQLLTEAAGEGPSEEGAEESAEDGGTGGAESTEGAGEAGGADGGDGGDGAGGTEAPKGT
ncbi:proteasome subunit alpha [Actinomadura alba]|uniref:Proteasome subunit alpha n=1 Tax=Actinomadura alba TaxID=406431 RepID=A0ABR7LY60_9ACTN|nr:proteasome subunit alpha [Actinomadura alba]MBC6469789.1 proteasome subunit alpha [Actinomadura alba]